MRRENNDLPQEQGKRSKTNAKGCYTCIQTVEFAEAKSYYTYIATVGFAMVKVCYTYN